MKTSKALIAVVVVALALASLGGCTAAKYVAKPNEELYGIWQSEKTGAAKMAIAVDGYKIYSLQGDVDPLYAGTIQITSRWTDSNENLWYKAYQTVTAGTGGFKGMKSQVLYRVGKSGEFLHTTDTPVREFDPSAFPSKLDPNCCSYGPYHRWTDYSPRRVLIGDMWSETSEEHTR